MRRPQSFALLPSRSKAEPWEPGSTVTTSLGLPIILSSAAARTDQIWWAERKAVAVAAAAAAARIRRGKAEVKTTAVLSIK